DASGTGHDGLGRQWAAGFLDGSPAIAPSDKAFPEDHQEHQEYRCADGKNQDGKIRQLGAVEGSPELSDMDLDRVPHSHRPFGYAQGPRQQRGREKDNQDYRDAYQAAEMFLQLRAPITLKYRA